MKNALALLLSVIMALLASAQSAQPVIPNTEMPDLEAIRSAIIDKASPYYYPRLMTEFERNDTLMKLDKFRHLYFGYMFQEDYNPYRPKAIGTALDEFYEKATWNRQDCDSVIKYCGLALEDNPFDLHRMIDLISAYKTKGKTNLAKIWQYKLDYILMAIASSGTGADEENAWYVIAPEHEYVLLNAKGAIVTDHVFYEPHYEFIKTRENDGSTGGYYFNIRTILEEYNRKYPEEDDPD